MKATIETVGQLREALEDVPGDAKIVGKVAGKPLTSPVILTDGAYQGGKAYAIEILPSPLSVESERS